MRRFLALLAAALLAAASAHAQSDPPPQRFGIALPPNTALGLSFTNVGYVTPDGRVALFQSTAQSADKVYRWTADSGTQTITLPHAGGFITPFADGTFVAAFYFDHGVEVYRWTPSEGLVDVTARFLNGLRPTQLFFLPDGSGAFSTYASTESSDCGGQPAGGEPRAPGPSAQTGAGVPGATYACTNTYRFRIYTFNARLESRLLREELLRSVRQGEGSTESGAWLELFGYRGGISYWMCPAETAYPDDCEAFVLAEDGQPRSVGTGGYRIASASRDASVVTGYDSRDQWQVYRNGEWRALDIPNVVDYQVSGDGLHETWMTLAGDVPVDRVGTLFQKTAGGTAQTLIPAQSGLDGFHLEVNETGDRAAMGRLDAPMLWSRKRGAELLHTYVPADFQLVSLEGRALLALRRTNGGVADSAYVLVFDAPVRVRDANRFGQPGTPLDSVEVAVGNAPAAVTDAIGEFALPAGLDPGLSTTFALRDLRTGRTRTVGPLRPADLADTTLVIPLALHRRLDQALVGLATSEVPDLPVLRNLVDAFLKYDTTNAHATRGRWTSAVPLRPSEYAPLDADLARLTMATENLDALHQSTRALSSQTASVAVQAVTTILAAQEAVGQVRAQLAVDAVFDTPSGNVLRGIVGTGLDALSSSLHGAYLAFNGSIEAALPSPWNTGWSWFGEAITKGIGGGIAGGGMREGGASFLSTLIETVVEKTGGPIIDAVYIGQTQDDLDAAAQAAALGSGTGEMRDAFVASATRANEASVRLDQRVQASQALLATAKGWANVGDVAMAVGKVPGAQIAGVLGTAIRVVSGAGLVIDEVLNVNELHTAAAKDSPSIQRLAFGQPTVTAPAREPAGPTVARAAAMAQAGAATQTVGEALDRYAARLAALDAAVSASGDGIAQTDSLQHAEASVRAALAVETARLGALASDTTAAAAAVRRVGAWAGVLSGEQGRLFAGLLPYLIPSLANDPDGVNDGGPLDGPITGVADTVHARIAAAGRAVDSLRTAHSAALAATASRTAPPTVAVLAVDGAYEIAPGSRTIRVRIGNVGSSAANGVTATLVADGDTTGAAMPVLRVTSAAEQSLGTLAAGAVAEATWTVAATDTSSGRGSVGTYRVVMASTTPEAVLRGGAAAVTVKSATGVAAEETPTPVGAATLESIGPNPAGERVRVRYGLPASAAVVVAVYDVLGREVRRLDRGQEAAGAQEAWVDVSGLAVGAYAVRLVADGRTVGTQRLMVMR